MKGLVSERKEEYDKEIGSLKEGQRASKRRARLVRPLTHMPAHMKAQQSRGEARADGAFPRLRF